MTKLALLVSKMEGFNVPNSIPQTHNNPGDLRHSPHSQHPGGPAHANDIGMIDTVEHGWEDLERQLVLDSRMTLVQFVNSYAPAADHNNTQAYLKFLCDGLGVSAGTTVAEALKIV
jgi:hypothetical protein